VDLPTAVEKYWAQMVAIATGSGWALNRWLDARSKKRAEAVAAIAARAAAKVDLTRLAQEVAAEAIQTLRDELHRQAVEIEELRREIHDIQRDHAKTMAEKDAEITLLRGRIRQLEATIAAHRRQMANAGLPLPAEPAFFEIADGDLRPMGEAL
jgi:predicted  nucleic acid-binding Zn-ribbon protein